MEFERYDNIKNLNHKKTLDKFFFEGYLLDSVEWGVTEKVHGAHFDVAYDGLGDVEFWTRKRKLGKEENFNNYHTIREELIDYIKYAYRIIQRDTGVKNFEIVVCGELYGGTYPHEEVKALDIKRIQKGVYYRPDVGFYAFDLKLNGDFINYNSVWNILVTAGFFVAETLFEGSFRTCIRYSNKFQTTIPDSIGLPDIDDNICEGIVLKPINSAHCYDGTRVIFKNRNELHKERSKEPRIQREPLVLSDKAQGIYNLISTYVTQNRLTSVLSKINTETLDKKSGFGTIMGDFRKDIMESFNDDNVPNMLWLDKSDRNLVAKLVGKLCVPLVKKEWMQILE